jgi:molybdenum-dependent DNA-binding transcriptional regulator ModE
MNTLHFKYALEVAKTHSITQAAENLFMAQPNLSKAIKELESSLDIIIFERSAKGVVPTPEGTVFLEYAKNVVSEVERMKEISKSVSNNNLKICIPKSYMMNECVSEFVKKNKDITLEIDFCTSTPYAGLMEVIYNNYRIAVVRILNDDVQNFKKYCSNHNLQVSCIWSFRTKAVISSASIFANKQFLTESMQNKMVKIISKPEILPFHMKTGMESSDGKTIVINDIGMSGDIIRNSDRYWMPDSPVTKAYLKKNQFTQLNLENSEEMSDFLVFKDNYEMTHPEKLFFDCIYSVKNTVDFIDKINY